MYFYIIRHTEKFFVVEMDQKTYPYPIKLKSSEARGLQPAWAVWAGGNNFTNTKFQKWQFWARQENFWAKS